MGNATIGNDIRYANTDADDEGEPENAHCEDIIGDLVEAVERHERNRDRSQMAAEEANLPEADSSNFRPVLPWESPAMEP